ncbi:neural cell adhesion molecule 2-like [Anneissia japonica]|uniref:neural cell adhesion molecule 2-like n=1 Tax=Anneissia japonica TaxID=1529436 RepID=UPI0014259CB2|nr:neural cell adhesion molecule 2-like [Anneissia japonica]
MAKRDDQPKVCESAFDLIFDISINTVVEGEPITFVCSVNSKPDPVVNLYKDETPISRETTTNLTYNIGNVVRSDRGNYKCEASNIVGSDTSQVQRLDVHDIPEFDSADEVTVGHEEQYVIELEVSANPSDVTYQWTTNHPGIENTDTNPATFTFNDPDGSVTVFTITLTVTNSIGLTTKSIKIIVMGSIRYDIKTFHYLGLVVQVVMS